jgi:drug/metabolite transporter (DMT)-like permease
MEAVGAMNAERPAGFPVAAAGCTIHTFGSAFVAIRSALRSYGPAELAALRFAVASAALGAIALVRPVRRPVASDLPRFAAAGTLGIAVYALLINYGETRVGAGLASFVINTSPVFTAILAASPLGERLSGTGWVGLGASLTGTFAIGTSRRQSSAIRPGPSPPPASRSRRFRPCSTSSRPSPPGSAGWPWVSGPRLSGSAADAWRWRACCW